MHQLLWGTKRINSIAETNMFQLDVDPQKGTTMHPRCRHIDAC